MAAACKGLSGRKTRGCVSTLAAMVGDSTPPAFRDSEARRAERLAKKAERQARKRTRKNG